MSAQTTREFTTGPLYRAAQAVYSVLGPTAGFLIACLPFAAAIVAGHSTVAIAVGGVVIGPAWTALLYATRVIRADPERGPFTSFWRGYRLNWRQTLAVWLPYWLLLTAAGADVASPASPLALRAVIAVIAGISLLWMSAVLLIISRYAFRTRDVLRLGGYLLFGAPRSTVTDFALLIVAGATIYLSSEFVLGLLAGVFALFAIAGAQGAFELVDARFTTDGRQDGAR
ncbi:DUF624 domain-containing protein [Gryllotalpicola daejeonensis]|uniref:DUF624 domain-containing protein n=1 Tax=Gryllotalpicola daejeonensis TaxID=993087 RepID=A0ABP7ZP41_9MICO